MLISDEYRQLNKDLHRDKATYGASGDQWTQHVKFLCRGFKPDTILDYGCGKGTLKLALRLDITEYDPAIRGKSHLPGKADLVVCTDVLEHIEPEHLDEVLQHLHDLTNVVAFLSVSTRPAKKNLPDGRNAHLIVEDDLWWLSAIGFYFDTIELRSDTDELTVLAFPKGETYEKYHYR